MNQQPDNIIQLLLVNEIRLMGNVIAAALEGEADIRVVSCVTTPEEALTVLENSTIDVVLVSTRLPDQGALKLIRAISENTSATKVLALGLIEEKKQVLRYVEAGAAGYIRKDDSLEDLVEGVRNAQEGKVIVSPVIAAAMMERLSALAQMFSEVENGFIDEAVLTNRELEVLKMVGQSMTNQQIADGLSIELGTVKNHIHNILEKLNVSSRGEAAAYLAFLKK